MEHNQTEITDFINHCKYEKNLSEKTIKAYSCFKNIFQVFSNGWSLQRDAETMKILNCEDFRGCS